MTAYYNEFDPKAAAWLRELIRAGLIAPGDVDERSIKDVKADDLERYTQCHFFAGIGGWSYALRLAGWSDATPVWTGSCPCQPYSSAGKQKGNADDRNLWPDFYRLIAKCKPDVVFGEQVEGAIRHGWLDGISADLEREGYAVGHCVLGAHSVGAPHIRQRLYWVADAGGSECGRRAESSREYGASLHVADRRCDSLLAESKGEQSHGGGNPRRRRGEPTNDRGVGNADVAGSQSRREATEADGHRRTALANGCADWMGISELDNLGRNPGADDRAKEESDCQGGEPRALRIDSGYAGASHWASVESIPCRDGKARRVAPGVPLLAHGIPGRVAQLRGLGNAIVPQVAAAFIEAYVAAARS